MIYRNTYHWKVYEGLSNHAANCLNRLDLDTREKIKEAVLAGGLMQRKVGGFYDDGTQYGPYGNSLGPKTYAEICKWIGLPERAINRHPTIVQCPNCNCSLTPKFSKGKVVAVELLFQKKELARGF